MPLQAPEIEIQDTESTDLETPSKVILFNDEIHTFEEVIIQLMKAVQCKQERAEAYAWEVHTRGKACVYTGEMNKCLTVSNILEEIGLQTQIEV
jgi:ATP-dependent Clp protease adaptor protein ClpS